MSFHVDIDTGIEFVRFIRYMTQNTRGPPGMQTRAWIDAIMTRLRIACEEIARRSLQEHHSDGPPLTKKWVKQKDTSWVMGFVTAPPYATSASDKNVWSGFLDDNLTSWISATGTIRGGNGVRVGYNNDPKHPHSGIGLQHLVSNIHFGFVSKGHFVAPRPFLNSVWANTMYLQEATRIINDALTNILTTGAP